MDRFAETADAVAATRSKKQKIQLLAEYFRGLVDEELALAAVYFTGMPYPENAGKSLKLGWAGLRNAMQQLMPDVTEQRFAEVALRTSDIGETVAELLPARADRSPGLPGVAAAFDAIASARGGTKATLAAGLLARCQPDAAKYVTKLITGELRIGSVGGLVEEAVAIAADAALEDVRWGLLLTGDIGRVAVAARHGTLGELGVVLFHPLKAMLASPVPSPAEAIQRLDDQLWVEDKYDGIRAQLHTDGRRVEIFSRDQKSMAGQFPEIVESALALPGPLVLDGEILAWRDQRALPFFALQRRLGRVKPGPEVLADIPVVFMAFDVLVDPTGHLLAHALEERRARLEALPATPRLFAAPLRRVSGVEALEAEFQAAKDRGNEGLMLKDPGSAYAPGRRGFSWLKLKRPLEPLDVVVTGVEWGHGKRRSVLSDYTFAVRDEATGELVNIGKAYSGLTDAEIATMTQHFQSITVRDFGRFRTVIPEVVIEIAFESIQESSRHKSGFALRFPRILRLRPDKGVADINTLGDVRAAWEQLQHR